MTSAGWQARDGEKVLALAGGQQQGGQQRKWREGLIKWQAGSQCLVKGAVGVGIGISIGFGTVKG